MAKIKQRIKIIRQEGPHGCAAACFSMIMGKSYKEVDETIAANMNRDGLELKSIIDYLIDQNYSIIKLEMKSYKKHDWREARKILLKPFAQIHMIQIQRRFQSLSHWVVMDKTGKFYCPLGLTRKEIKSSYMILMNLGIYK